MTDHPVDSSGARASIAGVTPDPATPAERAAAVLRAAEAAANAGHEPVATPPAPARRALAADAAERLMVVADELAAGVDDARDQLDDLQDALARLAR
jgi:hypothetical protein